ncbi:MAG: PA14 domain-containing protein [Rhodothermales bacterium]
MTTHFVRFFSIWLIVFLISGAIPLSDEDGRMSRPRDPWVFAGSLDDRPRILFVALHHDLWIAFDTQLGDIYKAWRGGIRPPSDDPDAFSPWPATIDGLTYFAKANKNNWRLIRKGEITTPKVVYRGYRLAGDRLTLSYQLISEYGHRIDVEESPEIVHSNDDRPGLQREFFIDQIPDDIEVALDVEMTKLKERTDVQTDGILQRTGSRTHSFVWGKTYDVAGRLKLSPGIVTTLTTFFAPNLLKNMENDDALDPLELFKHTNVYKSLDLGDEASASSRLIRRQGQVPGVAVKVYGIGESIDSLMQLAPGQLPTAHTVQPAVNLTSREHFGGLDFYFITHVSGYLNIASEGTYSFQVVADDGVRFSIGNEVLYEHNGLQAAAPSEEIDIEMKPGVYPISLEHFQSTGRKQLTLNWRPPWRTQFEVLEAPTISTRREDQRRFSAGKKHVLRQFPDALIDLEHIEIDGVHPGIDIEAVDISGLEGSVGGMDVLSDGRLVLSTWDGSGSVYVVDGSNDFSGRLEAREIAKGLTFPFGVKAVDDEVFVLQKHELTQLIDLDGDQLIDEYRVVANDWSLTNDFDEFAFGLVYREGKFYAGLSMPIDPEGAILIEDLPDRGHLVRLSFDGSVDRIASGFQLTNGLQLNDTGVLAVIDHRNPWFSDSRLLLSGKNSKGVFEPAVASLASPLHMASIWLPSGSGSEAPTQPVHLKNGIFAGQWIYGDLDARQLNRVFVERVNNTLQGAVFRFTKGLAMSVNRLVLGTDGSLIAGGMGFASQWKTLAQNKQMLQRISFTNEQAFEMKAIRVQSNGFEVEFSEPVSRSQAADLASYRVYEWPNHESEQQRRRDRGLVQESEIAAVSVSEDGLKVNLELASLKAGTIYYINLAPAFESDAGDDLWSNEAWYSLNELPGVVLGMNEQRK